MIQPIPKCANGLSRSQERIEEAGIVARAWEALKRYIMARERGRCRLCGKRCSYGAASIATKADPHHIIFQSAGGEDTRENCLVLCRSCHDDVHIHRAVVLSGNAEERDEMNRGCVKVERMTDSGYVPVGFI